MLLGKMKKETGEWLPVELAITDDAVFCRFTGAYDKNGQPIFEGDIVRAEVERTNYHQQHTPLHKRNLYSRRLYSTEAVILRNNEKSYSKNGAFHLASLYNGMGYHGDETAFGVYNKDMETKERLEELKKPRGREKNHQWVFVNGSSGKMVVIGNIYDESEKGDGENGRTK